MTDEPNERPEADRHLACRNLVFREGRPEDDEPAAVCADFCRTPIGLISILDCPVWIGRWCRFFEERMEEPEPLIEADLEELRERLRGNYMRWRYWKRVRELRVQEPAEAEGDAPAAEEPESTPVHEIPARPEAVRAGPQRKPRFPGDAPSGPPPRPVEEVDLDHLPDLTPGEEPESEEGPEP